MTPEHLDELAELAEQRLLAIDEEVRSGGSYLERIAVARALSELAERRTRSALLRRQAYQLESSLARNYPNRVPNPGTLASYRIG